MINRLLLLGLIVSNLQVVAAQKSPLLMEEMTWVELEEEIKKGFDTVILPVGATEQHGKHMPISSDWVIGEVLGTTVAQKLGRALVAPVIRVGTSHSHMQFAGTLSIRERLLQDLLRDYVFSLAWHGFRHIVVLSIHPGNSPIVEKTISQLQPLYPHLNIISCSDASGVRETMRSTSERLGLDPRATGDHAGLAETAMLLAHRPDLVEMRKAEAGFVDEISEEARIEKEGILAVSKNGVLGDPRKATPEIGRDFLKDLSDYFTRTIQERRANWQRPPIPRDLAPMRLIEPTGPLAKGIRFRRTGDYEEARSFFRAWLERHPDDAKAAIELAKTFMVWDKFTEAREILDPLLSHPDPEIRYMAHDKLGEVNLLQGQFKAAIHHKDMARRLRVEARDPIGQARKVMWMGYIQAQTGQLDAAEATLESGLTLTPSLYDTRAGGLDESAASGVSATAGGGRDTYLDLKQTLTLVEVNRGRLLQAARHLRALEDGAIEDPSTSRRFIRMHGLILVGRGRYDDALLNLSLPLKVRDYPEYQAGQGGAYLAAGRLQEAEARFLQLINLRGDSRLHTPDEYVRGYYALGQIYDRMGRREEAEAMYRKFLSLWGDADIPLPEIAEAKARLN